jgi:hypothetical protein
LLQHPSEPHRQPRCQKLQRQRQGIVPNCR